MEMPIREQVAYLMQGTEYGDPGLKSRMAEELRERLEGAREERRQLRVYCGFDPRTSDLHIGHTVPMRKLRQFQELGHEVIFVVGTYTSLIGDPSDKDKLREILTPEQVRRNADTYAEQAMKILDRGATVVESNDTWLSSLSLEQMISMASQFTLQQILTRESFRKRWDQGDPVYLHETFYALFQAYDAYHLRADVQVGGTDQLFNIVTASRKLMGAMGERPNVAIIMGILPGTDGSVKMSKSLANHVPLLAAPEDMYGKVMSLPDHAMDIFFRMVTRLRPEEISAAMKGHPRDAKMRLAREIVEIFHDPVGAREAERHFVTVFADQEPPEEMEEVVLSPGRTLLELIADTAVVSSRSEARRLIEQ